MEGQKREESSENEANLTQVYTTSNPNKNNCGSEKKKKKKLREYIVLFLHGVMSVNIIPN
jgi:hypothetical protein